MTLRPREAPNISGRLATIWSAASPTCSPFTGTQQVQRPPEDVWVCFRSPVPFRRCTRCGSLQRGASGQKSSGGAIPRISKSAALPTFLSGLPSPGHLHHHARPPIRRIAPPNPSGGPLSSVDVPGPRVRCTGGCSRQSSAGLRSPSAFERRSVVQARAGSRGTRAQQTARPNQQRSIDTEWQ